MDWQKSSPRGRPTTKAVAVAISLVGGVSHSQHLECWLQIWRWFVDCRVYILVFSSPDKQRLYDQGEIEAQSSFELANRMKTSEMSHMSGTYWVVVSCATTHEHSRMLNVTLTLFVWGFVLLQNLQDLGNKVCLWGLYVGQCWTWTVYDYHWPCQWFQIMDFGRHFVDWS